MDTGILAEMPRITKGTKGALRGMLVAAAALLSTSAQADVVWDMSIAWPQSSFHTQNAMKFAEAVEERTEGRVVINVHPGGALGIKGPESLRAVRDGIVPIAEMFLSQQAGDAPFFSIETMPFLVRSPEELAILYDIARPQFEEILESYNQKMLYIVPWPSQMIFTDSLITSVEDLSGIQIRTTDSNNASMMEALGMSPVAMPSSDLMPALASGAVQAVQTSAPFAADLKLWEFVDNTLYTNHSWSSNMLTVNLDRWNELSPEDQQTIEELAAELQPQFWEISVQEDKAGQAEIQEQGITITEPSPEMAARMQELTRPIWDQFMEEVPESREVIEEYLSRVGRE